MGKCKLPMLRSQLSHPTFRFTHVIVISRNGTTNAPVYPNFCAVSFVLAWSQATPSLTPCQVLCLFYCFTPNETVNRAATTPLADLGTTRSDWQAWLRARVEPMVRSPPISAVVFPLPNPDVHAAHRNGDG